MQTPISELKFEPQCQKKNRSSGIPSRSDTNLPVQLQKMARSLNFRTWKSVEWYYPFSENKRADQLRSYCEGDLHLCFHIGKNLVYLCLSVHMKLLPSRESPVLAMTA